MSERMNYRDEAKWFAEKVRNGCHDTDGLANLIEMFGGIVEDRVAWQEEIIREMSKPRVIVTDGGPA